MDQDDERSDLAGLRAVIAERGVEIVLDETRAIKCTVTQQVRFPRSKKRRIREKWSYRAENYGSVLVWVMFVPKEWPLRLIMHPKTWEGFGIHLWPDTPPTSFSSGPSTTTPATTPEST